MLSGEGLSFESLEIKFTDDDEVRKIGEIYAVGPSITILMEGYVENKSGLTSLRGTMVPAKEINKLIGKMQKEGFTIVPTKMYFKKGKAKIEIAVAIAAPSIPNSCIKK